MNTALDINLRSHSVFRWLIISPLTNSVCVCARACVCVCVFILLHLLVSSGCTTSVTYVRSSDQRSFVVSISWVLSANSVHVYFISYLTSKDETQAHRKTGEKTIRYSVLLRKDDMYGYRI